jgi:hypothetical protein
MAPWRLAIPRSMAPWLPFVFGAWLCVALVLLARVAYSCVGVWRLKRHSTPLPPGYQRRLDAWRRAYGLRRPVRIGGVERLATPVAVGLRRPMILTPVSLLDHLTEEEFAQVMLHELAHVQRRDDWTNLFQKLAQALLFFHPAVYWIARQMEQEREMACDDWVVALTRRPKDYAACLARLVELNVRSRGALVAPGMAVRKERVFERVRRLLDQGRLVTARLSRAGFLTVVLALVAAVLLMARLAPFFAPPDPEVLGRDEAASVVLVEPEVTVAVEPRALMLTEPVVVAVDVEPLILSGVETVLEPVEVAVRTAPVRLLSSGVLLDTLLTFRQLRLDVSFQNTGAVHQIQSLLQTRSVPQPSEASPPDLSVASWIRLLKAAARIASDGDRARFLIDAAPRMPEDERVYAAYLETTEKIGSSGDRKRALSALLDHHRLGQATLVRFLETVQAMPSDGDKARLLVEVASVLPSDEAVRRAYLAAASSISSSGDYRRALSALTNAQR